MPGVSKGQDCRSKGRRIGLPVGGYLVTGRQFKLAIRRLRLSQMGTARLLGVDSRTARRWVLDERRIPEAVAIILELMLAGKVTVEDVEQAKGRRK
jgi:hypothetical protein